MATGSKLASVYIDIDVEMDKAKKELKQVSNVAKVETDEMASDAKKNADKMEEAISGAAQKAALALAAIGGAVVASTITTEEAFAKVQNGLGASVKEMEEFEGIVEDVASSGKGSFEEVANAVVNVGRNIKGLQPDEIKKLSVYALDLQKTFDYGVNESTAAASILMNEFKMSGEEAFDRIAAGTQQGLDFNGDFLDTIKEYSPLFKQSGYSADEMFTLLKRGADEGTFNLDYLADLVKEVGIRFTDNSDTTADAMGQMSKDTQKLWKDMREGKATVQDVMNSVISDLEGMEDPLKRNELGVALMGTKFEDLGFDAVSSLNDVGKGLGDTSGKMAEASKNNETLASSFEGLKNQAISELQPLGEELSEIVKKTTEWIDENPELFSSLTTVVGVVGAFSAAVIVLNGAITVARTAMGIWTVIQGIQIGTTTALTGATTGLAVATTAATWPILAIVAAIALAVAAGVLLYKNWDKVKAKASALASSVSSTFSKIKESISTKINDARVEVGKAIEKIKGFMKFEWKLPKLKLPHFSVSGKLDLFNIPPKVPKVSVSWYKNGGIFDGPTAFQKGNGLGILGEAGPEAIIPLSNDKRMKPFAEAIAKQMGGGVNLTVNYQGSGSRADAMEFARFTADYLQQQNIIKRMSGGLR